MTMRSTSTRRQNRSCDQCRRSKRRCLSVTSNSNRSEGVITEKCQNCAHLRQGCTYDFANSRCAASKLPSLSSANVNGYISTQGAAVPNGHVLSPIHVQPQPQQDGFDHGSSTGHSFGLEASSPPMLDMATPDSLSFGLDMLLGGSSDALFALTTDYASGCHFQFPDLDFVGSSAMISTTALGAPLTPVSDFTGTTPSGGTPLDHQSPASLLRFSFPPDVEDRQLSSVFNWMMGGLLSRCLHSSTNIFTATIQTEYELSPEGFDDSVAAQKATTTATLPTLHDASSQTSPSSSLPKRPTATIIGLCLFLDHFAPFYGRWHDRKTRQRQLDAFKSVMRAFALHSFPLDSPMAVEFRPAWLKARSELESLENPPSFVYIYSVLLFSVVTPPQHESSGRDVIPMFDRALGLFQDLQKLVGDHCARLSRTASNYRPLLINALTIFHWYAFVRDTVESMSHEREPVLSNALCETGNLHMPPFPSDGNFRPDLVPEFCRKGIAHIAILSRRFFHLRSLVKKSESLAGENEKEMSSSSSPGPLIESLMSCLTLVEQHDSIYQGFWQVCFDNYNACEREHKISFFFSMILWINPVLALCELVRKDAALIRETSRDPQLDARLRSIQTTAVDAITRLAGLIMCDSTETFQVDDGVSTIALPMMALHANTKVILGAIHRAIKSSIELRKMTIREGETGGGDHGRYTNASHHLGADAALKSLLWCLLSLQVTESGRHLAQGVMGDLLGQWGDLIMECWTTDM